jgi:hypothetical protein
MQKIDDEIFCVAFLKNFLMFYFIQRILIFVIKNMGSFVLRIRVKRKGIYEQF